MRRECGSYNVEIGRDELMTQTRGKVGLSELTGEKRKRKMRRR